LSESEARGFLTAQLADYRGLSYAQLVALIGEPSIRELTGESGTQYQLEIEPIWDHKKGGLVRVLGMITDGTLRSFVSPWTDDFLVAPDGSFVGE